MDDQPPNYHCKPDDWRNAAPESEVVGAANQTPSAEANNAAHDKTASADCVNPAYSALVLAIGSRLRAARKASGVTLAKLHFEHGYSQSTINRWELRNLPTLPHLLKLCKIYNIQPSQILNDL